METKQTSLNASNLLSKEVFEQNRQTFDYFDKANDIYQRTKKAMGYKETSFQSVMSSTTNFKPKTNVYATTH